ncbi:hypothetical protein SAMN04489719_1684 [Agrococcus carbonis]|uniref:Uncharacterized protein n=1 Tax=Agrococcus carbonis TaxID=684552 RepID=A0A1H1Q053_9MICO|nr:hypothetical protein SAMN04489719_1684 [Agrococcus carbonis]
MRAVRANQATLLRQNYLGMKDSADVPEPNRFSSTTYDFAVQLRRPEAASAHRADPLLHLVWHDYPGEWFEQDASSEEEAKRRVSNFRALLNSDVAILLIDGQRLVDHAGEEERYLRSVLGSMRDVLESVKDELLDGSAGLEQFPRIWMIALSKADLLPHLDVDSFADLVVRKAGYELSVLRQSIATLVVADDALSVGEDFVLLSSARFEPGRIVFEDQVGVDLLLPIASLLPIERGNRWAQLRLLPNEVARRLLRNAAHVARFAAWGARIAGRLPGKLALLATLIDLEAVERLAQLGHDELVEAHNRAVARNEGARAAATQFLLQIKKAEEEKVLARSTR